MDELRREKGRWRTWVKGKMEVRGEGGREDGGANRPALTRPRSTARGEVHFPVVDQTLKDHQASIHGYSPSTFTVIAYYPSNGY